MTRKTKPQPHITHTLSQILEGYELAAGARQLSPHTLADYRNTFRKFQAHLDTTGCSDPPFMDISQEQIETFLANLKVSKKTRLNYHTGLSALWTWAYDQGYAIRHILHDIERPKPEQRSIVPYSETDLRAMMQAVTSSKPYMDRGTMVSHSLKNQDRNRAIILLLLDTGMRADELCSLAIVKVDTRNERVKVFGKGSKERVVPISTRTSQSIWRYWSNTRPERDLDERAFTTEDGHPLDRHQLRKLITGIGRRAGVVEPGVHRFRHTFAINYLRNGGDVYTLQDILGHATMEMCRRYLHLAQADAQTAHRRASPVMNMRL